MEGLLMSRFLLFLMERSINKVILSFSQQFSFILKPHDTSAHVNLANNKADIKHYQPNYLKKFLEIKFTNLNYYKN